ncbi:MAG: pantoate--beta-alanine ligase, partial [Kiritimatiellaeota bacterium]|nr:pantoate--beta-alanine ligase [Kiritimatiellota bacterium]
MKICRTRKEMQACGAEWMRGGGTVALVPTMGALHAGHLSLIRMAATTADYVVVSLFVNPTQFGPNEDFAAYPRTEAADMALCRDAGVAAVFCPAAGELYEPDATVFVDETTLSKGLCGETRPGHFRGVLTVVMKLFNIVQPDIAIFGQKDAQQVVLIERMVRDLDIPVRILRAPTFREPDGLAMSSRNRYLSPEERSRAICLAEALDLALECWKGGERDSATLIAKMRAHLALYDATPDYVACVDGRPLAPVAELSQGTLVALAVRIG